MTEAHTLTIRAIPGIPLIQPGDDLTTIIHQALQEAGEALQPYDVLTISSKIVSKAEGRLVDLTTITPSDRAKEIANTTRKDPRLVELVLQQSTEISRMGPGVLITRHQLGFVSANAGIDQSNIQAQESALLLPENPDTSARRLRDELRQSTGIEIGIVISDSHGRPFRMGNIGVAIGAAGLPTLRDLRGQHDLYGRELKISMQGYGDLIASAAHLVCGEGDEGLPVILVRGLHLSSADATAADLNRSPQQDLYRK